jgi:hypothetical protein
VEINYTTIDHGEGWACLLAHGRPRQSVRFQGTADVRPEKRRCAVTETDPALCDLSLVLQRDHILADDAAIAPQLGQAVGLGENPDELHPTLATWAAGCVWFVVRNRHGQ